MEVDDRSQWGGRDWSRSQYDLDGLVLAGRSLANEGRNKVGTGGFRQVWRYAALRRGRERGGKHSVIDVTNNCSIQLG